MIFTGFKTVASASKREKGRLLRNAKRNPSRCHVSRDFVGCRVGVFGGGVAVSLSWAIGAIGMADNGVRAVWPFAGPVGDDSGGLRLVPYSIRSDSTSGYIRGGCPVPSSVGIWCR